MISRWPTYRRPRPIPPGPRGYPWLRVLPQMRRDSLGFLFTTVTGYLRTHMLALTPWSARLPTPGRRRFQAALARLDRLVGQHIQARRQQEGDHGDLLALLLAARDPTSGEGMSAQQLRDEV